jgi:DNA-binding transcriptional regulator YbjK
MRPHFSVRSSFTINAQLAAHRSILYSTQMDLSDRAQEIQVFEQDAETLAVCQLELLAQLERQLRAVHHTMQHIEKLRSVKNRVEPELSPVQGHTTLTSLDEDIEALDSHLHVEHACCSDMRDTIIKMQGRLADLRRRACVIDKSPSEPA